MPADVRALIEEAWELARELGGSRPDDAASRLADRLARIAASGAWPAIPELVAVAFARPPSVARAATEAVRVLLARVPVRATAQLDLDIRAASAWSESSRGWHDLDAAALQRAAGEVGGPTRIQLAMCHPVGHVREAAVRLASVCADGMEARFLLLRLNDWVPQVRAAAAAAVRARLTRSSARDIVAALPLVEAAARWRRIGDGAIRDELERFVRSPDTAPALAAALADPDRDVRRAAFARALASPALDRGDVIAVGARDRDAVIRAAAGRHAAALAGADLERVVARLVRDPVGRIRARALELALARGLTVELEPRLADGHAGCRALAQAHLLAADVDVAARYRALLGTARGRRLTAAIRGLVEVEAAPAAAAILPLLAHPAPAARRAALLALASLGAGEAAPAAVRALGDPAPPVTRAAARVLRRKGASVAIAPRAVWDALRAAPAEHGRVAATSALARLAYWERLPYLLAATRLGEAVRAVALPGLRRWLAVRARRFAAPAPATVLAIRRALAEAAVDEPLRAAIRAAVPGA